MQLTGGCACGKVRYSANGEPRGALICHCRDCQRFSGAGGVPVLAMPADGFKVEGETRAYVSEGGSGQRAVRHFCGECGSSLFGTPQVMGGAVTLYVGSLDDSSGFEPTFRMYIRDRWPWDYGTALKEFQTHPS